MNKAQVFQAARDLSNLITARVYILSSGEFIPASDEDVPANIVAYTWYRTRSKDTNKWTIQEVK